MFVFSVKATRKHMVMLLMGLVAAIGMAVLALCLPPTQAAGGKVAELKVASAEERIALLREWGYEVTDETVQEIRLPDEADATLTAYEALQESAGMSLLKYCGKRVKLYTYTASDSSKIHLYMYRHRLIAGDVTAPDGTQTPLIKG